MTLNISPEMRAWLLCGPRLDLTLTVTGRCNFRCTYCYEDFSQGHMKPWVVDAVGHLIQERASDLRELTLQFFGGEPLLAMPMVLKAARVASKISNEFGFRYFAGMTTNGYHLTPVRLADLVASGVSEFTVSLDGIGHTHDATRRHIAGRSTFDVIWENLQAINSDKTLPVKVNLSLHVTAQNVEHWSMNRALIEDLCLDPRFRTNIQPIYAWGGPNDGDLELAGDAEVAKVSRLFESSDGGAHEHACYAAIPTSWVILPDGGLARCTLSGSEQNRVGQIREDGSLDLNKARLSPWFRGWETGDDDALSCPLQGMPAGDDRAVFLSMPTVG